MGRKEMKTYKGETGGKRGRKEEVEQRKERGNAVKRSKERGK